MNRLCVRSSLIIGVATILMLAACSTTPTKPEGAITAREKLSQLQADPNLASRAPVDIKAAEAAVRAAELPEKDEQKSAHLVSMANSKVDIATARAQSRLLMDQRDGLNQQRDNARLESRTNEADRAHSAAGAARVDANEAQQHSKELQRQLDELSARETDRGLVITLGDLLFDTGKSEIKYAVVDNLDKLALFLKKYPSRTVMIEGHTDNVGSDAANQSLSQRRADTVKQYLMDRGISSDRLSASGKGEGEPVAENKSDSGRKQNRRVEVIISTVAVSAAQS